MREARIAAVVRDHADLNVSTLPPYTSSRLSLLTASRLPVHPLLDPEQGPQTRRSVFRPSGSLASLKYRPRCHRGGKEGQADTKAATRWREDTPSDALVDDRCRAPWWVTRHRVDVDPAGRTSMPPVLPARALSRFRTGHSVCFGWAGPACFSHNVRRSTSTRYQIRPPAVTSYCHCSISSPLCIPVASLPFSR